MYRQTCLTTSPPLHALRNARAGSKHEGCRLSPCGLRILVAIRAIKLRFLRVCRPSLKGSVDKRLKVWGGRFAGLKSGAFRGDIGR